MSRIIPAPRPASFAAPHAAALAASYATTRSPGLAGPSTTAASARCRDVEEAR